MKIQRSVTNFIQAERLLLHRCDENVLGKHHD